jgi:allantoin racemase
MNIVFCNPFGTDVYDDLVRDSVEPYLRPGTAVEFTHLENCPRDIDYYLPKHLMETEIFREVVAADQRGVDAFVVGCCYDPGVAVARELTDMPVVGPLEASALLSRFFGHRFSVVTDHRKAVPELEDLVRLYGIEANCRSVRAIDWFVADMVEDPSAVARDALAQCRRVLDEDDAECVVLGCTIIAACLEREILRGGVDAAGLPIVNPNVLAIKTAELLADLRTAGQYRISRRGFYQRAEEHDPEQAAEVWQRYMERLPLGEA